MQRKRGALSILTIFVMVSIIILAAVMINVFVADDTYNRVQSGVNMAAKTRAQAIDIPLKEMTGYVEAYHGAPNPTYGYVYQDANTVSNLQPQPGNPTPDQYTSSTYQTYAQEADIAAKDAMVQYINTVLGVTVDKKPMVFGGYNATGGDIPFSTSDVCIDVEPLPSNSGYMNFSCQTALGPVTQNNVFVEGTNQLTYNLGTDSLTGKNQIETVENVVFVGVRYYYNSFFYNGLKQLGWQNAPVQATSALAYPQIDTCSYSFSSAACPQNTVTTY